MRLSIRQYSQALLELEQELGATKAKDAATPFFAWLTRRGEGQKMGKIIAEAEKIVRERAGEVQVTITTAHEADESTQNTLLAQAKQLFDGKQVGAKFVTDPGVVGGAKFRSDEVLYDTTVAATLEQFRSGLVK